MFSRIWSAGAGTCCLQGCPPTFSSVGQKGQEGDDLFPFCSPLLGLCSPDVSVVQNEPSSDLDFFSPRLVSAASCPSEGSLLPPPVSTSSLSQAPLPAAFPAPVVPASAVTHSTGSFTFSSGPAPALVPKAEPEGPEYPSSSISHRLDALDQLLEEAKV